MRKENLKRKGDDAENGSDSEEQEKSPAAATDKEEDAEMQSANENTEENGDSKEPGTDDDFEDAETGDDKEDKTKKSAAEKEKGKEEDGDKDDADEETEDVPLKKSGRGKPKPAKETNGNSKTNGDTKGDDEEEEGEKEEVEGDEGKEDEEGDADGDKDEGESGKETGAKKGKKGAAAATKKKDVKKTKPKPAKKTKKEEVEEDAEEEYEVQDIVDHRKERGKMVFRIRWKNYGAKDDTWEPEATLSCPAIIKRYKAKLKQQEEEEQEQEQEYEVQDIVDHRKERGKMVYRIRWKNFGAKDDTWEPESTLSCPEIIKRYKAKLKKEEEEDEEEEYEVQEIIDHRKERGKMVYRIRWKNFGAKDDTWEPESTLSCPEIIKRYKAKIEKEESAPPAKKARPGPKVTPAKRGAIDKKANSKVPPKKRTYAESEEEEEEESDDDAEYEVEKIIEANVKRNGQREYLVRWKGFSAKDDTWEPEDNLHCKDLIAKYNETHGKSGKSKSTIVKGLRADRKKPERLTLVDKRHKTSKRNAGKAPVNYYDGE